MLLAEEVKGVFKGVGWGVWRRVVGDEDKEYKKDDEGKKGNWD